LSVLDGDTRHSSHIWFRISPGRSKRDTIVVEMILMFEVPRKMNVEKPEDVQD
jgi:hypothetical protein